MNRRVYLRIKNDERLLGTVLEMLDPSQGLARRSAATELWMAVSWAIAEMVYEPDFDDGTIETFTIEIR